MHAQLAPQASILSPTSQWIWVSSGKITITNSLLVKRACECCYIQKVASMVELAAVKTAVQRQWDFFGMGAQGPGSEVSTTCRMSCHTACITALFSSKVDVLSLVAFAGMAGRSVVSRRSRNTPARWEPANLVAPILLRKWCRFRFARPSLAVSTCPMMAS